MKVKTSLIWVFIPWVLVSFYHSPSQCIKGILVIDSSQKLTKIYASWESKLAFIWVFLSFQLKLGVLVLLVQERASIAYMCHCTQNIPDFDIEYRVKC